MCGIGEQIGDRHRLFTGWTKPSRANTAAETPAVRAILLTEITGLACRALIDGAWPRRTRWDDWKRRWMPPPPRLLAARVIAKTLPTHTREPLTADRADR